MNILVIRFRQMGDAIIATSLLNTLKYNFPDAQIHFVLNNKIAALFDGHPSINKIITFTEEERHNAVIYINKVWSVVHSTHYDVIIDMRSTFNTMLFSLFSPKSKYRIGIKKTYSRFAFNHHIGKCSDDCSILDYDLLFAKPLNSIKKITPINKFSLYITDTERIDYRKYLEAQGIDISKPIMIANVTAKLKSKVWAEERMMWIIEQYIKLYPDHQIIFNYAPGQEEINARKIFLNLGRPQQVFIDIQAHSPRELYALGTFATLFFGNEGGARHIMHAANCPSFVICAPTTRKHVWLPQNETPADGISSADVLPKEQLTNMSYQEQYSLITKEMVWKKLEKFIKCYIFS